MVIRIIGFPRPQRDPAHRGADADTHTHADTGDITEEADQSRRIDRHDRRYNVHRGDRLRRPGPTRPDLDPAPVMEGRETPGRVIDPGPAPGRDEGPMTLAIRCPIVGHLRVPDVTVIRRGGPLAVIAEILGTRHRNRRSRWRGTRFLVAGPDDETVFRLCAGERRLHRPVLTVIGQDGHLAGPDIHGNIVARHLGAAAIDDHLARMRRIAGDDLIPAGLVDGHGAARRGDLIAITVIEVFQVEIDRSLRNVRLEGLIVELVDIQLRPRIEIDGIAAQIDDGVRAVIRPDRIAAGNRVVRRRGTPGILIRRMEGYRPVDPRQPPDPRRRIDRLSRRVLGQGHRYRQRCDRSCHAEQDAEQAGKQAPTDMPGRRYRLIRQLSRRPAFTASAGLRRR